MSYTSSLKLISLAAAVSVTGLAQSAHFDPPDLTLEFQLHREFLRSRGQVTQVVPQGLNENYRLQSGETLGSLSEMLYGDSQYWPRVWAQNKSISNPHLVRPGHQLQFLMGSEDETPSFRFTEEGDEAGLELVASNGQNPIVEIPPPEVPPKPLLKVPNSFPEWQSVFRKRPDKMLDDRGIRDNRLKIPDRIFLRGYVQDTEVEGVGSFLENDSEAGLPIVNQYVFVKVKKGIGHAGKKMLVVKDQGRLKRLNKQWDPDKRPYLVQIMAEIELREITPAKFRRSRDREEYDSYRALVTKATGLAANDCVLIPGEIQVISLENKGPHGTTEAQVIGSEKHSASALFAPGDLVFLNKGASDGVQVGQLLDIFADRSIRRGGAIVTYSPVASGTIKVVKVSGGVSTAILLVARDSVQQGDLARQVARRGNHEELEKFRRDGPSAADDDDFDLDNGADSRSELEDDENSIENEIGSGEAF